MPPTLDPQAVALAKAIRDVESGGNFNARGKSGEFGAYQFMPATWKGTASKFGINVPLEQATPEQQNQVAYMQIKEWKDKGWNVGEIASAWNAGPGRKDAYITGNAGVNNQGVSYDTRSYAEKVAQSYQTLKTGVQSPSPQLATSATAQAVAQPQERTLGGFAQNVVKSGASLLGGVGEAILHPLETLQNIGSVAVGGLQTIAGQETENTQNFDNLVGFFKGRYGSMEGFEKTLYEDPVGFAADLSTVLGGAGLAAKGSAIAAKSAKAGGVSDSLNATGNILNKASDYTNPLSPVATGVGKVVNAGIGAGSQGVGKLAGLEPATIQAIRANPDSFTPAQIASVTREAVGNEVGTALSQRLGSLKETAKEYRPIKDSIEPVPVSHNYLEEQIRKVAGLDVIDGKVIANSTSAIRTPAEVSKLQGIFNLYKPSFQKGALTPAEFLNLRSDLADLAYNEIGKKNTNVAEVTDKMRANLNTDYRKFIKGLEDLDVNFSTQKKEFSALKKGIIDKDGKLTDAAYSLIANAGNKGNAQRLARLEEIVPGITKKLEVLKAIEDIQKSMGNKVGTYGKSILEAGGVVGGLVTGQWQVVVTGFAAAIIAEPANAVKIIRAAESIDPKLVPLVLARVARYATISSTLSEATEGSSGEQNNSTETESLLNSLSALGAESSLNPGDNPSAQVPPIESTTALDDVAKSSNFDLSGARAAGYSDEEILAFLEAPVPNAE